MSLKIYLFLVTSVLVLDAASADIFRDIFKWNILSPFSDIEDEDEALLREEKDSFLPSACNCTGIVCDCCVDFNITNVIDLGGPGCVSMKYISKEEGVWLNVSYGKSLLHSQTVTSQSKKKSCTVMLSYLAEICAKFSDFQENGDEMFGCLNFEPIVLGEATAQYPVGCFRMGPNGMFVDNTLRNNTESEESAKEEEDANKEQEEEELTVIEAINQSAQESLEFISSLLGLEFNSKKDVKNSTETAESSSTTEKKSQRKTKNILWEIIKKFI